MIRLAVNGAAGRMGRMVVKLAACDERFELVGAIEIPCHQQLGTDSGVVAGIGTNGLPITESAQSFEVLIDFSTPNGTLSAIEMALTEKAALVTGTTSLGEEHHTALMDASRTIGVFQASNFSLGITALAQIVGNLAKSLPKADVEIVEAHHAAKADSPSGTAITLAKEIANARGTTLDNVAVFGRHGRLGTRPPEQIGIHAIRGGGIIGDHRIFLTLPYESIILEHRAISRELFAAGALEAAAFIHEKTGYFDMKDLMNLNQGEKK